MIPRTPAEIELEIATMLEPTCETFLGSAEE